MVGAKDRGNAEQVRAIAEQVTDAAIARFATQHPEVSRGLQRYK